MNQELLEQQCIGFLNTPPLWKNEQFNLQQFEFPEIVLRAFEPKPIPPKIRLGHQMEHIFKQLLEYCPDFEVLVHNLPIRKNKQTIGEIDFIVKNVLSQELFHIELTYKFYIINPEISEPIHQVMGPNKRDMFFTKMEKIKNEQFPLLHSDEGSAALAEKDIDLEKIAHQTCYKAQLFGPYGSTANHIRPLNNNCIVGYWLRFDDLNSEDFRKHRFYIPYKSEWVIAPHANVVWLTHFELLMEVNLRMIKEHAPMVWVQRSNNEFEKIFVVWW